MILEFVAWLFMELLMYNLGRAVIAVVSLGRVRAESLKEAFRTGKPAIGPAGPQVVVPAHVAQFIGVAVFTVAIALLVAFYK